MPTKKQKSKKVAVKKVMILESAQKMPRNSAEEVAALQFMQSTPGWKIVERILNENIQYLNDSIVAKKDIESGESLTEEECDDARKKRELSIELRDTPKTYIEKISQTIERDRGYDPYDRAEDS